MTSSEKKKELLKVSQINKRVEELNAEIEMLWSQAVAMSPNTSGMPSGGTSDGTKIERVVERLEKAQSQLTAEVKALHEVKYKIISAIQGLSDIRERRVLHLAYIGKVEGTKQRPLSLWKVANEMGYSYDRIRHIHGEALLHLEL